MFWITNGWNNFQGDMAAGAGACGAGYWFVPVANSDIPDLTQGSNTPGNHMAWADGGVKDGEVHYGYAGKCRLTRAPAFGCNAAQILLRELCDRDDDVVPDDRDRAALRRVYCLRRPCPKHAIRQGG